MYKYIFTFVFLTTIFFQSFSQNTTVYTCKNGTVDASFRLEFSQQQIQAANAQTQNDYGFLGITVIGDASNQYNCHSYAWHLREGNTNKVWINNASTQIGNCYDQTHNIDKYWTDGCFIQVCNESEADKTHYFCGDHSATVSTTNTGLWESKWGQLSVVRHTRTGVPYAEPTSSVNFYASTKIAGDISNLCIGTRTFTVKNISGGSYTWTYGSSLSIVGATNTNQITVQRNGSSNGAAWVEVQISTPCSGTSVTNRVNFTVGVPPTPTSLNFNGFSYNAQNAGSYCLGGYTDYEVSIENPVADASYAWIVYGGEFRFGQGFPDVGITSDEEGYLDITVQPENSCGLGNELTLSIPICDDGLRANIFTISPNPASNNITIDGSKKNKRIKEIQIIDKLGKIKRLTKYPGNLKVINFDISGLSPDIYYVKIYDGQKWEIKPLKVQ